MNTNLQGNIGEAKAIAYFIEKGYNVYLPFGTASTNDMIVEKDCDIKRVSVKTTKTKAKAVGETNKYTVKIRQGKLNKQIPFDTKASDILCVYILPENRFVLLDSKEITSKFEITVS
jgi:hypothetical protein